MDAYKKVTADQVNKAFRDLFIDNVRRLNIKLTSENHANSDNFKDLNKQTYTNIGATYKEFNNLADLYH